jgi:serine kinase of HPr protein (carbohydrate metabolism regulator)
MFYYFGFGFIIQSEIEFPELVETVKSDFQLTIRKGLIPEVVDGKNFSSSSFSYVINNNEFLFSVDQTARYFAKNGVEIIVEITKPEEDSRSIRLYILATVMAAILLQKNKLAFHGSAVILEDHLLVIAGDSGAGKSTLLATLIGSGGTVFSDDILVFSQRNFVSKIMVDASYPMIKLWEDTLAKLNDDQFCDKSFRVRKNINKFGFFFHKTFDKKSYPISTIVILKKGNHTHFMVRELENFEAFNTLNNQIYRSFLIQSMEHRIMSFKIISNLLKTTRILEITRPIGSKPKELMEFLKSSMSNELKNK